MNGRWGVLVGVLVVLVAIVATVSAYFGGSSGSRGGGGPSGLAGAPVASFEIPRLGGGTGGVGDYRGHVVFVNLWATWCAPCRSETPALERLSEQERARGLVVLGIDQGESASTVAAFVRSLRLTYPMLVDGDQAYGRAYASVGLPTSVAVDRNGRIVAGHDGELTLAEMHAIVDPLLAAR